MPGKGRPYPAAAESADKGGESKAEETLLGVSEVRFFFLRKGKPELGGVKGFGRGPTNHVDWAP